MKILCSISTRGRYYTTLPLTISSVLNQTVKPDKLIIYDDNNKPEDVRENFIYQYIFQILDIKGIPWEWVWADGRGFAKNNQAANTAGYDWVWRVDDDTIAEPNVLETLISYIDDSVGAIGGSILTPPLYFENDFPTNKIENITVEPNLQWKMNIDCVYEVEHLHCSFLYRTGVHEYHQGLSRVCFREDTLFSNGIHKKGYRVLVVPKCYTWHLKNPQGGVRSETDQSLYDRDDQIFRNIVGLQDKTVVIVEGGMGDHIVLKRVLPLIKNPEVFSCYPEILPGKSIQEAKDLFGDISNYNIYQKMDEWNWTDSLENAYKKLYGVK